MGKSRVSIGDRYGSVTIISRDPACRKPTWIGACDCGNSTRTRTENLTNNSKCLSCSFYRGEDHYAWSGEKFISGTYFAKIKKCARSRNFPFEINISDIVNLVEKQKFLCALSGVKLSTDDLSLDRIDSDLGYFRNNIQVVHKKVNRMKWVFTNEKFLDICTKIATSYYDESEYTPRMASSHSNWNGCGDLGSQYYNNLRNKARKRKIYFDLDICELWDLFELQNYRCGLTGVVLQFGSITKNISASLDRKDNNQGYIISNVNWVHKEINLSKGPISTIEYTDWAKKIYDFKKDNL